MKICLLITTYKRNIQLMRLLTQISFLKKSYSGEACFYTLVTDSDHHNPLSSDIKNVCDTYIRNEGFGFDDNIFHSYRLHSVNYDFIFSISDDDLFNEGGFNPLDVIELAAKRGKDAVLFNHCEYRSPDMLADDLVYTLSNNFYQNPRLMLQPDELRRQFLGYVPRHVGIMYKSQHIIENINIINLFRDTLHLYAAPFIVSLQKKSALFIDYPINRFSSEVTNDGAWEDRRKVFFGLYRFLIVSKFILDPGSFQLAKKGFMQHYLGERSWLRKSLIGPLPSEAEMLREIDRVDTPP